MIKRFSAIAPVLFALAACSDSAAEQRVKELLVDPSSAEFSDVYSKDGITCGFVNSKNRVGGFTGPQPFIVRGNTAQISGDVPDAGFVDDLKDCDSRVTERLYRVMLHDKIVGAERQVRTEDATHH